MSIPALSHVQAAFRTVTCPAILVGAALFPCASSAQTDTLTQARELGERGRPAAALKLLRAYAVAHPEELPSDWLRARMAYWSGHFAEAEAIYDRSIAAHPDNLVLQLDHATMLVELGDEERALPVLEKYAAWSPQDANLLLAQARAELLRGDLRAAEEHAMQALKLAPDRDDASRLLLDIQRASGPWSGVGLSYTVDDQRLEVLDPMVACGMRFGRLADLSASLHVPDHAFGDQERSALWAGVTDKLGFRRQRLYVGATAGLFKQPWNGAVVPTGALQLEKRWWRFLALRAGAERRPYTGTIASLDTALLFMRYQASLTWDHPASTTGAITCTADAFDDANTVRSWSAWVLAPPLRLGRTQLRLGAAYAAADANGDRYRAMLLTSTDGPGYAITDLRYLYFTPHAQRTTSLLLSWRSRPEARVRFGVDLNYGVHATADVPYFYADRGMHGDLFLVKGFAASDLAPWSADGDLVFRPFDRLDVRLDYVHTRSNFYVSDHASVGITYHFIHGRPGRK